ncbi:MAG: hypothetical protein JW928_05795 [Candidatus Aureabacteria bacterium]|nr:hypothetical protein [Candidatus Auribacterota bacterium]
MPISHREKSHFEDISRFFLSGSHALERTLGILSYNDDSLQSFFTAHVAAYLEKKGNRIRLIDMLKEFPSTRSVLQKEDVLESPHLREGWNARRSLTYVDTCSTLADVACFLSRNQEMEKPENKEKIYTVLNLPFDSSAVFWQVLRMMGSVIILTGDTVDVLLRTTHIIKKLMEKRTFFRAGIIFSRLRKKSDPREIFEKICSAFDDSQRSCLISIGEISPCQEVFHSLLSGHLLFDDKTNSEFSRKISRMLELIHARMTGDHQQKESSRIPSSSLL